MPTIGVGLITEPKQAETIVLQTGQADMVALARAMLYDPRWPWHAAAELGAQVERAAAVLALAAARVQAPVRRYAAGPALNRRAFSPFVPHLAQSVARGRTVPGASC
jgi:2,4-dienoyl-CoA reductase-like NADH-dependent reductase (Old Yellow Enzyme family)